MAFQNDNPQRDTESVTSVHVWVSLHPKRRTHPLRLTLQRRMLGAHQRPSPCLFARLLLLIIHLDPQVCSTQQGRRAIYIDRLVLARTRHEGLVEDGNMLVPSLVRKGAIPVPSLAVNLVVRKLVETLKVAEVHDRQQVVV